MLEALLAGADAAWEVPLCESRVEAPAMLPVAGEDEEEAWLLHGEERPGPPRRGRLPGAAVLAEEAVLPEAEAAPPNAPAASRALPLTRRRAVWLGVGLLALTACLVAVGRAGRDVSPVPAPLRAQDREMAALVPPLEAVQAAAAPPLAAATPAAVTSWVAPSRKEESPVKKPPPPCPSSPRPPAPRAP